MVEKFSSSEASSTPEFTRGEDSSTGNIFMRLEDRFQGWRARRSMDSGREPTADGFIGYGTRTWVRVLARVVVSPRQDPAVAALEAASKVVRDGLRGWHNFVNPPLPFARVTVSIAGREHSAVVDRGGVLDVTLAGEFEPGWQDIWVTPEGGLPAKAEVRIVEGTEKLGVVCDVDDTVMVTSLPRPMLAAWNTFILDEHARATTPGMPVLVDRLTRDASVGLFVYLSTSPWNVANTLRRFMARNLYPKAPLLLTDWGPTATRFFRSGVEHKESQLERLVKEFPDYQWILIGDDGQHDEAIYARLIERHPERVRAVVIRQLSAPEAMLAGGRSQHLREVKPGQDIPWVYAPDGAGIARQLMDLGLIEDGNSSTEDDEDLPREQSRFQGF